VHGVRRIVKPAAQDRRSIHQALCLMLDAISSCTRSALGLLASPRRSACGPAANAVRATRRAATAATRSATHAALGHGVEIHGQHRQFIASLAQQVRHAHAEIAIGNQTVAARSAGSAH
jgi:hypothetical protein